MQLNAFCIRHAEFSRDQTERNYTLGLLILLFLIKYVISYNLKT